MKKIMKMYRHITSILLSALFIFTLTTFTGCEDPADSIDFTVLESTIADAQNLFDTTVEGTMPGQYPADARTALDAAISAAETVRNTENVTQAEVDAAVTNLLTAIDTYNALVVGQVMAENLMLYLPFSGNANDESGNGFNGTPKAGHIDFGAGDPPSLTADRFGNANSAYYFEKGGNIEIPYSATLNPEEAMSVSFWCNREAGEKLKTVIMAMNRHNGYMFTVQNDKLYSSLKCVEGGEFVYNDALGSEAIPVGEWAHFVVTYTSGNMKLYKNGQLSDSFDQMNGTLAPIDNIALTIGSDLPTSVYTEEAGPFYVGYGGYFTGAIDEVRFYNIELSGADVTAIYDMERP